MESSKKEAACHIQGVFNKMSTALQKLLWWGLVYLNCQRNENPVSQESYIRQICPSKMRNKDTPKETKAAPVHYTWSVRNVGRRLAKWNEGKLSDNLKSYEEIKVSVKVNILGKKNCCNNNLWLIFSSYVMYETNTLNFINPKSSITATLVWMFFLDFMNSQKISLPNLF